jgi:hypothetical protein
MPDMSGNATTQASGPESCDFRTGIIEVVGKM